MGWFSKKTKQILIELGEEDFKCLVSGGSVVCDNINIQIKYFGFEKMDEAIDQAKDGIKTYKQRTVNAK